MLNPSRTKASGLKMGRIFRLLTSGVIITTSVLALLGAPAQAVTFDSQSDNWAGAMGKPASIGSEPVTLAYMNFDIPVLDCKHDGYLAIWAGMDSVGVTIGGPTPRVTQAGLLGQCTKGAPVWSGWYEAYPAVDLLPLEGLPPLHAGQNVTVWLEYRPDIAPDAFVASIFVTYADGSQNGVGKTFYSPSGATQRSRGECIVERPAVNGAYKLLPKFTAADGTDFKASCAAGTIPALRSICGDYSNCLLSDIAIFRRNGTVARTLVDATSEPNPGTDTGIVRFRWLAGK